MHHILKKANGDFSDVVKTTILMKDMNDFQAVNKIYGKYFTNNLPARMAFQVNNYICPYQLGNKCSTETILNI